MAKMLTTTRSLLIAGALAFAALPALAQTSTQTQPAAPATSGSNMPGASTDMGTTGKTTTSKPTHHTRKIASTHKSNVHHVSTKKHITSSKTQKPTGSSMGGSSMGGSSTGTGSGTGGTPQQ
jgi:hypothetical protein